MGKTSEVHILHPLSGRSRTVPSPRCWRPFIV